jgi:hypothetical protein
VWERGQVHRGSNSVSTCTLKMQDWITMFVRVKFSTYEEGCPICLKCCSVKKKPPSTDRRKWTPWRSDVSEKEKAHHPQWMATPQHVHLGGGRDNERVLFSIHNVPCTHHRLPCAMASSDNYGSKGTKRVGWDGMGWDGGGGIYRLIASLGKMQIA